MLVQIWNILSLGNTGVRVVWQRLLIVIHRQLMKYHVTNVKKCSKNVNDLQEHEKSCFQGHRYACHLCTHTNLQKSLLREHIKGKHEGDPFWCSFWPDETFIYKKSLNKHVISVHTPKEAKFKYNCPECDFASDNKTEYQTHINHHENVKHYKCNLCSQAFFSQSQLMGHLRDSCIANKPKPVVASSSYSDGSFECTVCGKMLRAENSYQEHFFGQHVDNQDREWFYCEICISRFLTIKGLDIHNCCPPDPISHKRSVLMMKQLKKWSVLY